MILEHYTKHDIDTPQSRLEHLLPWKYPTEGLRRWEIPQILLQGFQKVIPSTGGGHGGASQHDAYQSQAK